MEQDGNQSDLQHPSLNQLKAEDAKKHISYHINPFEAHLVKDQKKFLYSFTLKSDNNTSISHTACLSTIKHTQTACVQFFQLHIYLGQNKMQTQNTNSLQEMDANKITAQKCSCHILSQTQIRANSRMQQTRPRKRKSNKHYQLH